jgi:hypothetical protein
MRQHMKRFARLTAAHSKKIENHAHMVALYTTWYNFARINSAVKVSPAMAAGIADKLWDIGDIVNNPSKLANCNSAEPAMRAAS